MRGAGDHSDRPNMRHLLVLATTMAVAAMLIGPSSASANNDPHRIFLPFASFDLDDSYCDAFPVHVDGPVNREYGTVSTLPDGSTFIKVTGSFFVSLTNRDTGKTIVINASGPGSFTISPDGTTMIGDFRGRGLLWDPNLTKFGFPSNVVAAAGPVLITGQVAADETLTFTSVSGHPHVITDVCAALS